MQAIFKHQLMLELRRAGYYNAIFDEESQAVIPVPRYPSLKIMRGGVSYGSDWSHNERDLARGDISDVYDRADDACNAWDRSEPFPKGVSAPESFQLVDECRDAVLAVRDDGERGLHFVTWEYNREHTALNHGHYTTDFQGAKADFALRAGLVDKERLLQDEDLPLLYRALRLLEGEDPSLSLDDERQVKALYERLERLDPGIRDKDAHLWQGVSDGQHNAAQAPEAHEDTGPKMDMQMT